MCYTAICDTAICDTATCDSVLLEYFTMNRPAICCQKFFRNSLSLSSALALLPTSLFLVISFHFYRETVLTPWSLNSKGISPPTVAFYAQSDGLRARHRFGSYEEYLQLQLNKTLNAKLRKVWGTMDWRRKINVFSPIFRWHLDHGLVERGHKVVCIGARLGQEVVAFKEIGIANVVGIDLVPAPPLVIQGDIHSHPFADSVFDFEFSNVFDHALFPQLFVSEIERTLKPSGVAVLHVALHSRPDKFSVNDLVSVDALLTLFKNSSVVHIRRIDAFGLDTEVAMRKKSNFDITKASSNCSASESKAAVVKLAEPLILTEPKKPWITLKKNLKTVKYLPSLTAIGNRRRYIYVDIGARNYGSSIGSWFQKSYPKQGHNFTIYAIEADSTFRASYANHAEVKFMPYAAWIRNESLLFGSDTRGNRSAGHVGMGRIQQFRSRSRKQSLLGRAHFIDVQGLDIAEWLSSIAGDDDLVVMKMDVEGAEFALLPKLVDSGAICLVDELFLECHYNRWQHCCPERTTKYNRTYHDCLSLFKSLRRHGVLVHQWW